MHETMSLNELGKGGEGRVRSGGEELAARTDDLSSITSTHIVRDPTSKSSAPTTARTHTNYFKKRERGDVAPW